MIVPAITKDTTAVKKEDVPEMMSICSSYKRPLYYVSYPSSIKWFKNPYTRKAVGYVCNKTWLFKFDSKTRLNAQDTHTGLWYCKVL
jgi:hypothetical protein